MKRIATFLFVILSFCFLLSKSVHAQSVQAPMPCFFAVTTSENYDDTCLFFVGHDANLYQIIVSNASGAPPYSQWNKVSAPLIEPGSDLSGFQDTIYGDTWLYYLTKETSATSISQLTENLGTYETSTTGSALPASTLAAYTNNPDYENDLIFIGTDHHIHQWSWTPVLYPTSTPPSEDVTALTGAGDVSGTVISSGIVLLPPTFWQQVMYVGTDKHIHELYRWVEGDGSNPPQTWYKNDLTADAGAELAASGTPIATFYDPTANLSAVFYVGEDKHIHELYFLMSGSKWQSLDLTSLTNAPEIRSDSPLAAGAGTDEAVFYLDQKGNVRELWASPSAPTTWNAPANSVNYDAGGANPARSGSPLVGSSDGNYGGGIDQLFYIGTDGNLHMFFEDGPWYATDITAASGAPKPRN
jgi:hypothetical protein